MHKRLLLWVGLLLMPMLAFAVGPKFKTTADGTFFNGVDARNPVSDLADQVKMSHAGERAALDELLKTWINPRCYGE